MPLPALRDDAFITSSSSTERAIHTAKDHFTHASTRTQKWSPLLPRVVICRRVSAGRGRSSVGPVRGCGRGRSIGRRNTKFGDHGVTDKAEFGGFEPEQGGRNAGIGTKALRSGVNLVRVEVIHAP